MLKCNPCTRNPLEQKIRMDYFFWSRFNIRNKLHVGPTIIGMSKGEYIMQNRIGI